MRPGGVNDVMHRKRVWRILGIWEKSVSWVLVSEEEGWLSGLAEIRPVVCGGDRMWWGGRWKSQHRKIVYLSPYVEKPFNSKVIKGFVPELRSRKFFRFFRDSYVIYIWVLNILCTFHISIYYEYVTLLHNTFIRIIIT